jgi:hypothetical protein
VKKASALVAPPEEVQERFWSKVVMGDDCWLWQAAIRSSDGIGVFGYDGKILYAHRLAWVIAFGPLPSRAEVRRTCGNLLCVRPLHLLLIPKGKVKIDSGAFPASENWLM